VNISTRVIIVLLGVVVVTGTVFFRWAEGWSWIDSYFFTVVTLSTVGYGNLVPVTVIGKIGTTVFIFSGLGIFALAIQQFGHFAFLQRRRKALEKHRESKE
jgi:voltage-gated potassium channel